jgi:hypothetical protein
MRSNILNHIQLVVFLCSFPLLVSAQARWQRVYTGADSLIEIDTSSLTFESESTIRATFRTVLAKPESLSPQNSTKYKIRLETFVFRSPGEYRFHEVRWLDAHGNEVHNSIIPANDWRVLKQGGIMEKLFASIGTLPPFGRWKIVDYRLADGPANGAVGSKEMSRLIGQHVYFDLSQAQVGSKVCHLPVFQSKRFSRDEFFRELGIQLASVGVKAESAETISVMCKGDGWAPRQSMLIALPHNQSLMLWQGVFLVLDKRERFQGFSFSPLKRSPPVPQ